jgi:hypothetical protein
MRHHLFKTTNNLACFIPEWDEGVEPVTIPTQSIIDVPAMPSSDFGFVGVRWQGQTFLTLIRHFIASRTCAPRPLVQRRSSGGKA